MARKEKTKTKTKRALLRIDGEPVEIVLRTNPRAHRFIVKVDPSTGQVSVVAPSSRSLDRAFDFAREERDWIAGRLAGVPKPVPLALGYKLMFRGVVHVLREGKGNRPVWVDGDAEEPTIRVQGRAEHATRRVQDWLKKEARRRIVERATEYAAEIGVKPKHITIRDTTSRWGSCSTAKSLSFSWRLILAPPHVLDYVVRARGVPSARVESRAALLASGRYADRAFGKVADVAVGKRRAVHRYAPRRMMT